MYNLTRMTRRQEKNERKMTFRFLHRPEAAGISGSGAKARATMYLFRNSDFTDAYRGNQVYLTVGSPMYVGIYVEERDPSFAVVVEDCYVTPSASPHDSRRHFLIQNK